MGFPEGLAGRELLARVRRQAGAFGVGLHHGQVMERAPSADRFSVQTSDRTFTAKSLLLAAGVTNHRPQMSPDLHDAALAAGRIRYCPVCDGFEVTGQSVAVVGSGPEA